MPPKRKTSVAPEEKAERRRNAARRYYLKHPEVQEKNRLHAAEKKAAAQARRRRWDSAKPVRREVTTSARPTTSPTEHDNGNPENGYISNDATSILNLRTVAEHVAAIALAEMAEVAPGAADGNESILSGSLASFDSILVRVNQLSTLIESSEPNLLVDMVIDVPAAPKPSVARVSQESTWVLTLQATIAELNAGPLLRPTTAEAFAWEESGRDLTPSRKMMSVEHWDELAYWAREVKMMQDNAWDMETYREFRAIATELTHEPYQHVGRLGLHQKQQDATAGEFRDD
ncbi:hypothetical protein C8R44DRAFT_739362 [Mycena epipterygia]|nr:hypothetical protein C8R44DRAFT_739362 [Mycena epipterygia]